jgi:hypothetical protein
METGTPDRIAVSDFLSSTTKNMIKYISWVRAAVRKTIERMSKAFAGFERTKIILAADGKRRFFNSGVKNPTCIIYMAHLTVIEWPVAPDL